MRPEPRPSAVADAIPLRLDSVHPSLPPVRRLPVPPASMRVNPHILAAHFRQRLAEHYHFPAEGIRLIGEIESAPDRVVRAAAGPIVIFPPSISATRIAALTCSAEVIAIARGWGREEAIDPAAAADLPTSAIAWIESPSNPLGSLAPVADVVRLARSCHAVIVDERLSHASGHSLLPLAGEFENVVILRSLAGWPAWQPVWWWAAGSTRALARLDLDERLPPEAMTAEIVTALANLDHPAAAALVRAERSRLFRMLRKFSFLEPIPSWGPFLPVRIALIPRARFVGELARRGIRVHVPAEEGLESYVRIAVGSRTATDRLQTALREMAPFVLG